MKSTRKAQFNRYLFMLLILVNCFSIAQFEPAQAAILTEFYVDTISDSKTNNTGCSTPADTNECSLRGAIQLVNDIPGASPFLIHVPAGVYDLPNPGSDDTNTLGDLDITSGNNLTIDGAGMDITIINGHGNFDRIIDHQGEADLTLSDLTIQNGSLASGLGGGGGIRSYFAAELTLDNVRVTSNTVTGSAAADSGGGVFVTGSDLSIIGDSQIDNNSACHGGGIMANSGTLHSVYIEAADVTDNTARCEMGGGILIVTQASVDIRNTNISGNHALRGAGYLQSSGITSTLTGVRLISNFIDTGGTGAAGMEIYGTATVSGSVFSFNVGSSGIGGIRLNSGSTFTMTDSILYNNFGAFAGGMYVEDNLSAELKRVEISRNTTTNGGGITVVNNGAIDLENVTISGNTASMYGGGLYLQGNLAADLNHVTIADNTGTSNGDAIYIGSNGRWSSKNSIIAYLTDGDVCYYAGTYIRTSYGHNILSDNTCGLTAGTDLVDVDPVLGELNFYRSKFMTMPPMPGSPAIDGAIVDDPVSMDQRGFPRIDGDLDGIIESDIGAHEYYLEFFLPLIQIP